MPGIGSAISNVFSGGSGGGFQPTDINTAPGPAGDPLGVPPGFPSTPTPTLPSPSSTIGWGGVGAGLPGGWSVPGSGTTAAAPLWQQLLLGGMLGSGEIGNILQSQKQSSYQNQLLNLMKNPAALSQMVLKAEQPISNSLVQAVGNQVQGDVASRGLAQSPGVFAATESQALAPFQQQQYQTALQQVLASLQAPAGTFQQPTNLTPALALFLRSFGNNGLPGTGGGSGGGGGTTQPYPQFPNLPQAPPPGLTLPTGGGDNSGFNINDPNQVQ